MPCWSGKNQRRYGGISALIFIPREVDNPKEAVTVLGSGVNPCSEPPRTQTHVAPPPRMLTALLDDTTLVHGITHVMRGYLGHSQYGVPQL